MAKDGYPQCHPHSTACVHIDQTENSVDVSDREHDCHSRVADASVKQSHRQGSQMNVSSLQSSVSR